MVIIATRIFSKLWRDRNVSRSLFTQLPQQNLSVQRSQTNPKATDEAKPSIKKINPLEHPDYFEVHKLFTIKDLFDAKVHYGHKDSSLNDHMRPFVYGSRLGHLIIDLNETALLLKEALNFIAHIAYNDGIILFIAKNPQVCYTVEETAKQCGEYAHTRHWNHGTLVNSMAQFGTSVRLPDACILIHTMESSCFQHPAVVQAAQMCIPTIGIVDTNCNPTLVTYPIPGNDDTPSAIELYCKLFKEVILKAKHMRKMLTSTEAK